VVGSSTRLPLLRLAGGDRFAFYAWNSLFISFNGTQGSDEFFEAFDAALRSHVDAHPDGVWMYALHRVERVLAQPSAESRKRSAELLKMVEPILRANVMVFDMRGMTGAIVRTFVSGIFLLNRSKVLSKVCDDPVDGAEWLRDLTPTVPGLIENFTAFRQTILATGDELLGPSPRR
jgi:hypothetical protein